MPRAGRPTAFWFIMAFLAVSVVLMLVGQTMALVDYDFAVRLGLQESRAEVGEFGVQVNRAFGAGDTAVYVPLMVASLWGLWRRRRWSLLTTAAVAAVSAYWAVTVGFMLLFLPGTPGYGYVPGAGIWGFVVAYAAFGAWGLGYVACRGDRVLG